MGFLKFFFRGQSDGYVFKSFSFCHLFILAIAIIVCYLIFRYRLKIRMNKKIQNYIKYSIAAVLLMQQVILYAWYIGSGYKLLLQGLPLYNCRVAIIASIIALMSNKKYLRILTCYWGVFGGAFALLSPGVDPFSYPHYTLISYFVGHLFLVWAAMYIFAVDRFKYTKKNLKQILIFTNIYHLVVLIINLSINANYCYLNNSPIRIGQDLPQTIYTVTVIMLYNIAIILSYLLISKITQSYKCNEDKLVATLN